MPAERNTSAAQQSNSQSSISRRGFVSAAAGAALAAAAVRASAAEEEGPTAPYKAHGERIRQSVIHWCFKPMSVEDLASHAASMGVQSVELVAPEHWPTLKKHGLTCAIAGSHGFERGFNNPENHAFCIERLTASIEAAAEFGCPNVITLSGMRGEIGEEEGKANMVTGLKKILPLAEKKGVTLCLEVLNSRVDEQMKGHPGYQCDTVEWAVDVCDRLGSDRMKILFDIYHVQIMQGDIITRIRKYKDYIAHYHTAGVPGRRELDEQQENNYPAIMRAIAETGYKGFVGQEFIPTTDDPIASLRQAVELCDV